MSSLGRLFAGGFLFSLAMSAADVAGIWTGQLSGRNNEKQDIAFEFKSDKGSSTGVLFGDEFDLPLQELSVSGDRISFSVTVLNYYDNRSTKFMFNGVIKDKEIELTRNRVADGVDASPAKRPDTKQTFTVRRQT